MHSPNAVIDVTYRKHLIHTSSSVFQILTVRSLKTTMNG